MYLLENGVTQSNRRTIMDDPFIRNYIEDLLKNIRTQVLLKLIKPYTRIRIPFISKVCHAACVFSMLHLLVFVVIFWPEIPLILVLSWSWLGKSSWIANLLSCSQVVYLYHLWLYLIDHIIRRKYWSLGWRVWILLCLWLFSPLFLLV